MKKKYDRVIEVIDNGWKVQVNRNSLYYIVKIGKEAMNHYDKKAKTSRCHDIDNLYSHLYRVCSFYAIDYNELKNKLNKAIKLINVGNVSTTA